MSGYGELRGVGGWLGFFVISFGILSPIFGLFGVWTALYGPEGGRAAFGDAWNSLQIFEWCLLAISVTGMWFAVWRLINVHRWTSVRITIAIIWLIGPANVFIETSGVALLLGLPFDQVLVGAGTSGIQPFIFSIIWTAYFLRSERVANTYPWDPEVDEMAETFA